MKEFDFLYSDEKISKKEIFVLVPSVALGVGVLTLPRAITSVVPFSDGWMSIVLAGIIVSFAVLVMTKLTSLFPEKTFYEYSKEIVGKPLAILFLLLFFIQTASFTAFESRSIATISKQYIFDRTPVEIISLAFLLVVVYAVSGSRAALLRLNLMFFPIVFFILIILIAFNIPYFELGNLKPFFEAQPSQVFIGVREALLSFTGVEILLFYMVLLPKKDYKGVHKYPMIGIGLITLLYFLVYMISVAVFSIEGTRNMIYPTLELSKEVSIPGGIIERIEPIFFTVWSMTIFNSAAIAYDICILAISTIFKKVKKITWIVILTPLIYLGSSLPQDIIQLEKFGTFISYSSAITIFLLPLSLYIVAKVRGVSGNAKI